MLPLLSFALLKANSLVVFRASNDRAPCLPLSFIFIFNFSLEYLFVLCSPNRPELFILGIPVGTGTEYYRSSTQCVCLQYKPDKVRLPCSRLAPLAPLVFSFSLLAFQRFDGSYCPTCTAEEHGSECSIVLSRRMTPLNCSPLFTMLSALSSNCNAL